MSSVGFQKLNDPKVRRSMKKFIGGGVKRLAGSDPPNDAASKVARSDCELFDVALDIPSVDSGNDLLSLTMQEAGIAKTPGTPVQDEGGKFPEETPLPPEPEVECENQNEDAREVEEGELPQTQEVVVRPVEEESESENESDREDGELSDSDAEPDAEHIIVVDDASDSPNKPPQLTPLEPPPSPGRNSSPAPGSPPKLASQICKTPPHKSHRARSSSSSSSSSSRSTSSGSSSNKSTRSKNCSSRGSPASSTKSGGKQSPSPRSGGTRTPSANSAHTPSPRRCLSPPEEAPGGNKVPSPKDSLPPPQVAGKAEKSKQLSRQPAAKGTPETTFSHTAKYVVDGNYRRQYFDENYNGVVTMVNTYRFYKKGEQLVPIEYVAAYNPNPALEDEPFILKGPIVNIDYDPKRIRLPTIIQVPMPELLPPTKDGKPIALTDSD